jgi:hypothetical protein
MSRWTSEPAITTFEDLICNLEYVDPSDLLSDIPTNTRAELKRVKRNVSRVLSLLDQKLLPDGESCVAAEEARRECLLINSLVFRLLLFQRVRMPQAVSEQLIRLRVSYGALAKSCHHLCLVADPGSASKLAEAFQIA